MTITAETPLQFTGGRIAGPLIWQDRGELQLASAVLTVICPVCGDCHRHDWLLDGKSCEEDAAKSSAKTCSATGGRYFADPIQPGERGFESHEFDPFALMVRQATESMQSQGVDCG